MMRSVNLLSKRYWDKQCWRPLRPILLLSLLIHLCFAQVVSADEPAKEGERRQIDKIFDASVGQDVDLGTIDSACHELELTIRWRNTLPHKILIEEILPGCKCLSVKCENRDLDPKESTDLDVVLDLHGLSGHVGSAIALKLKDKDQPMWIAISFFRPLPPTITPSQFQLGDLTRETVIERRFQVGAVVDAEDGICRFPELVVSKDDERISCHLLKHNTRMLRFANAARESTTCNALYELRFTPNNLQKDVLTKLTIPVTINNRDFPVELGVRGRAIPECRPRPSRIVLILPSDSVIKFGMRRTVLVKLERVDDIGELLSLECSSDDSRLRLQFIPDEHSGDSGTVGQIRADVDLLECQSFTSSINVEAKFEKRTVTFSVPVRVRFL